MTIAYVDTTICGGLRLLIHSETGRAAGFTHRETLSNRHRSGTGRRPFVRVLARILSVPMAACHYPGRGSPYSKELCGLRCGAMSDAVDHAGLQQASP